MGSTPIQPILHIENCIFTLPYGKQVGAIIYDKYSSTYIFLDAEYKELSLLRKIYEELDNSIASTLLDEVEENSAAVSINGQIFGWDSIKEVFDG